MMRSDICLHLSRNVFSPLENLWTAWAGPYRST
jgi:hypothetical protein